MHEAVTIVAKYFVVIPALVFLYVLLRVGWPERKRLVVTLVVSAVMTALFVKLATTVYHDPRPFVRDHVTPYFSSSTDNGFPSDHTVFAALLAWLVFTRKRTGGIVLLVLAILIGACRVIAGVHHGIDIAGGFVLASVGFWLSLAAVRAVAATRKTSGTK